ncbi:MAG: hypothetical protein ACYSU7_10710 [Planctomycetota bacterium]|jgi:hypothetical protein
MHKPGNSRQVSVTVLCAIALGGLAGCKMTAKGPVPDLPIPDALVDLLTTTPEQREQRRREEERIEAGTRRQQKKREAWQQRLTDEVDVILAALHEYCDDHDGVEPPHAAALVAGGYLEVDDLILPGSRTDPARVPVGNVTLSVLGNLPPEAQERAALAAASALSDDVVAHRLGDYIFVYHGVEAAGLDNPWLHDSLWHVVGVSDPAFNHRSIASVHDVTPRTRETSPWVHWEPNQNATRAEVGLPLLPNLATVTYDTPATRDVGWEKTLRVFLGLLEYLDDHAAPELEPGHAAVLVAEGYVDAEDLILPGSRTDLSRIRIGDADLDTLADLSPAQRQRAVETAADALPDDAPAHRLGDFVFVYQGTRTVFQSYYGLRDNLWLVVGSLDPEANGPPESQDDVWLMFSLHRMFKPPEGWDATRVEYGEFSRRLRSQNATRANGKLPPLPDLATVTHSH